MPSVQHFRAKEMKKRLDGPENRIPAGKICLTPPREGSLHLRSCGPEGGQGAKEDPYARSSKRSAPVWGRADKITTEPQMAV